jgi:putative ABC transport system substrate-binding protein
MRRREFIGILGGAAVLPLIARAQQASKLPTIGYLGASTSSASEEGPRLAVLVERLKELGWIEGRTVRIEYRWAAGQSERFTEFAAEFVRLKADIIVTYASSAVIAVKHLTSTIPIVFAGAADPVGTNLVASLAHPGGNATGVSLQTTDIAGKRLELLRDIVPGLRRLAVIANIENPYAVLEMTEVRAAARELSLDMLPLEIRRPEEIAPAFDLLKGRAEALYVSLDPVISAHRVRINILAVGARIATLVPFRAFVQAGGLMCYAPNQSEVYRRTADYVDKILRGAKAADLPVEQPTKFDLIVNITTAKAIGLEIPPTLLARADEVIE